MDNFEPEKQNSNHESTCNYLISILKICTKHNIEVFGNDRGHIMCNYIRNEINTYKCKV